MSRREFTMVEGTANKFWAIALDGSSHTVEFGKIGTPGQSARKEFDSDALAKASHDKLVAEKVKKGYIEQTGQSTAPAIVATPAKVPKPKAKEPEVVVETPPADPVLTMPERSIDFEPADWFWANWRANPPLPRPKPRPFDRDEALTRLKKVVTANYGLDWEKAKFPANPTVEESRFWLSMLTGMKPKETPVKFHERMAKQRSLDDVPPPIDAIADLLMGLGNHMIPELAAAIFQVYPFHESLPVLDRPLGGRAHWTSHAHHKLVDGFRRFVRPYLDADELRSMREVIRAQLPAPAMPPDEWTAFPMSWYLAAALGLGDEVAGLIRIIPDGFYAIKDSHADQYHRPQSLVLGLPDPNQVKAEWRRLGLVHQTPGDVVGWLVTTGFEALGEVRDSILATSSSRFTPSKEIAEAMTAVLPRVKAPEAAPVMLELMLDSKVPKPARQWLDDNPAHAIAGLIATAGGKGKLAAAALDFLREQKRKGRGDFLRQRLEAAPGEAADRVRSEVLDRAEVVIESLDDASTPEDILAAIKESAKLRPPGWVTPESLPKVLVGSRSMTATQVSALLAGLAKSTLEAPTSIVTAVRLHGDRASLDAFAWALFERWQRDGSPSKEKWAMGAVGLLGTDASALKLTPLIRVWPGESQHGRAVFGLECLRTIGTDGAMMRLNGIAQKLPFKGLKAKAAEMMEAIARDRKMTRAQLEDRIVPECDLDERGSRVFDFGPRQFTFVLGPEMKPMVRDPDGKLKPDLPKPGAKDDPTLSTASIEAWKLLKKQIKEVAKIQAERLEQAMVVGRRWTVDDFETLLVKHPLMTHLVRLVLWGGYDGAGKLVSTFRVTEERDFADVHEKSIKLDDVAKVGIVHPLNLPPGDASAWGEIFGDYEIIPPFPQLGRSVHRLEPRQQAATSLKPEMSGKIPGVTLVGILERLGWTRGIPQDAGVFYEHSKAFEGANVTAVIMYEGAYVGDLVSSPEQEIDKWFVVRGIYTPEMYPDHEARMPLGEVDPVVLSEVLGVIEALVSKAT